MYEWPLPAYETSVGDAYFAEIIPYTVFLYAQGIRIYNSTGSFAFRGMRMLTEKDTRVLGWYRFNREPTPAFSAGCLSGFSTVTADKLGQLYEQWGGGGDAPAYAEAINMNSETENTFKSLLTSF